MFFSLISLVHKEKWNGSLLSKIKINYRSWMTNKVTFLYLSKEEKRKQYMERTYSDVGIVEGSAFIVADRRAKAQGRPGCGPSRRILRGCVPGYSRWRSLRDAADRRRRGVLEARIIEGVRILGDLGIRHQHQVFTCGNRW